jgi:hypothetical protein
MARALHSSTRLVFSGTDTTIETCRCEYKVENDGLYEDGKSIDFDPLPAVTEVSNTYWAARMAEVKTDEGLT